MGHFQLYRAFGKYAAVKAMKVDNITCWEYTHNRPLQ